MNHPPATGQHAMTGGPLSTNGACKFAAVWWHWSCAVITFIAAQWLVAFEAANLVMLYLLGVVIVALFYGRWPSVLATVINVVSFDLVFVAPRGTLAVSDVQYLLTFG
ncbi:DUF4118 domain-containing protein [Escherichia coli]